MFFWCEGFRRTLWHASVYNIRVLLVVCFDLTSGRLALLCQLWHSQAWTNVSHRHPRLLGDQLDSLKSAVLKFRMTTRQKPIQDIRVLLVLTVSGVDIQTSDQLIV